MEEKNYNNNIYLVAIVAIVAVVGLVVLINGGTARNSSPSSDLYMVDAAGNYHGFGDFDSSITKEPFQKDIPGPMGGGGISVCMRNGLVLSANCGSTFGQIQCRLKGGSCTSSSSGGSGGSTTTMGNNCYDCHNNLLVQDGCKTNSLRQACAANSPTNYCADRARTGASTCGASAPAPTPAPTSSGCATRKPCYTDSACTANTYLTGKCVYYNYAGRKCCETK